jgi:hypothetical protein
MSALHDIVVKGSTDRSVTVRIIDSSDGTPETGVVYNTAGIDLWYRREGGAKTSITEATLASLTAAHADGGFLHIADGVYRLDLPDAAFATGANSVEFGGTVTGMIVIGGRVRLVDFNLESSKPDVNVAEVGGDDQTPDILVTMAGDYDNESLEVNVTKWTGTVVATPDTVGYPVVTVKDGTGQGELQTSSGRVNSNLVTVNSDSQPVDGLEQMGVDYDQNSDIKTNVIRWKNSVAPAFPTNFSDLAVTATTGKVTVGTNDDKSGYSISGTITTLDGLDAALDTAHGAGSWATATGFSTHNAADVWSATTRTLSAFGFNVDLNADQSGVTIGTVTTNTDMRGTDSASTHAAADVWSVTTRTLSAFGFNVDLNADQSGVTVGTVSNVSDKTGYSISGSVTTLDGLNAALNTAHGSGSWVTATGFSTHDADAVWTATTRTLSAFGFDVDLNADQSDVTIGTVNALASGERDAIANALFDLANSVENGVTLRNTLRLIAAGIGGKCSGADMNAPVYRNLNDDKNVISATTDTNGNRTAVTRDLT